MFFYGYNMNNHHDSCVVDRIAAVVAALAPHLPEGEAATPYDIRSHVHSPQFTQVFYSVACCVCNDTAERIAMQAVEAFDSALLSGDIDFVATQFGLDPSVSAAHGGRVSGLLHALMHAVNRK